MAISLVSNENKTSSVPGIKPEIIDAAAIPAASIAPSRDTSKYWMRTPPATDQLLVTARPRMGVAEIETTFEAVPWYRMIDASE